jgi:hypothetical protein
MPVPDFSPGEVLTAAAMDSIGLWLVKTQTVGAGVASVTVTGAFSADYENYRIVINQIDFSVDGESLLMTLGGVTGNVYKRNMQFVTYSASGFTGTGTATAAQFLIGFGGATDNTNCVVDVYSPQLAKQTSVTAQNATQTYFTIAGGICTSTVQSTDFTISCGSGTMTGGTIRVYGYRN